MDFVSFENFRWVDVISGVYILSLIGLSASLFLAFLFLSNKDSKANSFLGIFFILLAIKLGKLLIIELTPIPVQNIYFNIVHATYLAIGPVVMIYIFSYCKPSGVITTKEYVQFIPTLIMVLGAFQFRKILGEEWWQIIYWITLFHPVVFAIIVFSLIKSFRELISIKQTCAHKRTFIG